MGNLQSHARILLDQDNGRSLLFIDAPDDPEDLPHDKRRESQ